MGDGMVGGPLGHGGHEMREFSVLREARREENRIVTLDLRSADFGLFRRLID